MDRPFPTCPFHIRVVPRAGLEPARIAPHAPQTCAATNYATSACPARAIPPQPVAKIIYFFGVALAFGAAAFVLATLALVEADVVEFEAEFAA